MTVSLGDALSQAIELCAERGRDDLFAKLIDELWLIGRFPAELFPDGPPPDVVERMVEQRVGRFGESAR